MLKPCNCQDGRGFLVLWKRGIFPGFSKLVYMCVLISLCPSAPHSQHMLLHSLELSSRRCQTETLEVGLTLLWLPAATASLNPLLERVL